MAQQDNLYGQKHIWMPFFASLRQRRVAHAYLVHGPSGSTYMDVLRAMAKALLCPEIQDGFCDKCPVCARVEHGTYADLHIIVPEAGKITLDKVRGVLDMAYQYPMEGAYRVFLIQDPERMNVESANMLLKVLEEPPSGTFFLLGTENPSGVLPTIASRCQAFRLRPLPEEEIQQRLEDELGLQSDQAKAIARLADGSLGVARALADAEFIERREQAVCVLEELLRDRDTAFAMACCKSVAATFAGDREGLIAFVRIFLGLLRDAGVLNAGGSSGNLIHGDISDELESIAKRRTPAFWHASIDMTLELIRKIRANMNAELILGNYFLALQDE